MLETHDHGAVRELRLARPPANALAPELVSALADAVTGAPGAGAEALVVSGAPGMFSAGLDVPYLLSLDRPGIEQAWRGFYRLLAALAASELPVAAAITGHSPAGGAVISLFCDRRVMADGPFAIGLNEVQVGIPLPRTLLLAFARVLGNRHVAEGLAVEGAMLSPAEALRVGLVHELAPPGEVVPRAVDWCSRLLALPRQAMLRTRAVGRRDLRRLAESIDQDEISRLVDDWFSDETQRTLRALVARLAAKKENGDERSG